MIQPTELRIGNWMQHKDGGAFQVLAIEPTCIAYDIDDNNMFSDFVWYSYEDLAPIPLSEEVLIACGFTKIGGIYELPVGYDGMTLCTFASGRKGVGLYDASGERTGFDCEHLHQLQNMYHGLTKWELEVSLPLIGNSPITDNK